jgi:hypothetical protein
MVYLQETKEKLEKRIMEKYNLRYSGYENDCCIECKNSSPDAPADLYKCAELSKPYGEDWTVWPDYICNSFEKRDEWVLED